MKVLIPSGGFNRTPSLLSPEALREKSQLLRVYLTTSGITRHSFVDPDKIGILLQVNREELNEILIYMVDLHEINAYHVDDQDAYAITVIAINEPLMDTFVVQELDRLKLFKERSSESS